MDREAVAPDTEGFERLRLARLTD